MIEIRNLELTYRASHSTHHALRGVSLSVPRGALLTLLGPSGCGKTTLLRSIAGLETPDHGSIRIDGETVFSAEDGIDVPSARRNLGMVFQSYAIWPHMSVFENAAFPLRYRSKVQGISARGRVMECLALVQLQHLADRPAPMLSGGQQQRLALARALVASPKVLLLDEPLSNLDARLREEMRFELRRIVLSSGVTTIFVTHEQTEALSMSDIVAVMKDGNIVQADAPRGLYQHPSSEFVANFLVRSNLVPGTVRDSHEGQANIDSPVGVIACLIASPLTAGSPVTIVLKPESVSLLPPPQAPEAAVGQIEATAFMGDAVECAVRVGPIVILAKLPGDTTLTAGDTVAIVVAPNQNTAFPAQS